MKKLPISIIGGLVSILVTVILYFTIIGNIFAEMICFVTLLGVILAEGVVTYLACKSKGDPRKFAAANIFAVMVPVAIVLSIVYIANFPEGYGSYLGWYFAIFAIIGLVAVIIGNYGNSPEKENLRKAKENMLYARKLVKCILLEANAEKYKKELNAIEEKLHFSNDAVITRDDADIQNMLKELQENISDEDFDAKALIEAIDKKIDTRNILAKRTV